MSNFTNLLLASITIALLAYLFVRIFPTDDKNNEDSFDLDSDEDVTKEKHSYKNGVRKIFDMQPRKDGTILITSGASGAIHEAGLDLAKHGYHVLFGIQSEVQRKAFTPVSGRKGIELINFNMYDPSTFPDVIYRLRIIKRDLQRPLSGIVINLIDSLDQVKDSRPVDLLEAKDIENVYKHTFSSPMKTVQAFVLLVKHQNEESEVPDRDSEEPFDASGFRIVVLTKYYSEEQCFLHCVLQNAFVEYVQLLTKTNLSRNLSTSIIPIVSKRADAKRPYSQPVIPWELDLTEEDESGEDGFSDSSSEKHEDKDQNPSINENNFGDAISSITHALGSRNPWSIYPPTVSLVEPIDASKQGKDKKKTGVPPHRSNKPKRKPKSNNPYEQYAKPKRKHGQRS